MKSSFLLLFLSLVMIGCGVDKREINGIECAVVEAESVVVEGGSFPVFLGGYGSAMAYNDADSCFYLLTDRGPNVDGIASETKVFPIPDYAPTIGRFKRVGDKMVLLEKIILKDSSSRPFTGLPNNEGDGVTGEVAFDLKGNFVAISSSGLDTEGLAIAPDGTFWVSDEYAPFVMQFDRSGVLMRELSPSKGIPAHYANRRPNRGMEGLTISKDGAKLYGIMQSPLYYPDASTKEVSVNNRIIEIDVLSGATREFIYQMDSAINVVSDICFVSDSVMLVLERDGKFPRDGQGFKRIYKININGATDVGGRIVEMLSTEEMNATDIIAVEKRLFLDILAVMPDYRHDKPEGIALINGSVLCVVNDDDFGINATGDGNFVPKLDYQGVQDRNMVYFFPIL